MSDLIAKTLRAFISPLSSISKILLLGILFQPPLTNAGTAAGTDARYSWTLPKTIVDATVRFEFVGCDDSATAEPVLILKVTPTLVAKTVPDPKVGLKEMDPGSLISFWQNSYVEIKTFENSRILKSMGSQPASALNTIVSNIAGGVSSIVAANLGVPVVGVKAAGPGFAESPKVSVENRCGSANALRGEISLLQCKIKQLQREIANLGVKSIDGKNPKDFKRPENETADMCPKLEFDESGNDEQKLKNYAALIKAAQDQINALEPELAFTVKRTIDPAVPSIDGEKPVAGVGYDGNISRILLFQSLDEILEHRWLRFIYEERINQKIDPNNSYDIETKEQLQAVLLRIGKPEFIARHFYCTKPICVDPAAPARREALRDALTVNFYLEFQKALPKISICAKCRKQETFVAKDMQFRQAVMIPIAVYQGQKGKRPADGKSNPRQLSQSSQYMPFAQFGRAMSLPVFAGPFESLKWSVTFTEFGELVGADFSSQSIGAQMTQLFATAAATRYAIAAEERAAAALPSSETQRLNAENSALKAQIDNINYNNQLNALRAQGYVPR
jgi:hypothetical protein